MFGMGLWGGEDGYEGCAQYLEMSDKCAGIVNEKTVCRKTVHGPISCAVCRSTPPTITMLNVKTN